MSDTPIIDAILTILAIGTIAALIAFACGWDGPTW